MSKKIGMIGLFAVMIVLGMVSATISYNATYTGTISGTVNSNVLTFEESPDLFYLGSDGTPTFIPDKTGLGGFDISGLSLPANTETTFVVCVIRNNGNTSVNVNVVADDELNCIVTILNPNINLQSKLTSDVIIKVTPTVGKGNSFSFSLIFTIVV